MTENQPGIEISTEVNETKIKLREKQTYKESIILSYGHNSLKIPDITLGK